MSDDIAIRSITRADELETAFRLRTTVWRAKGVAMTATNCLWTDEHDEHAHHVGAFRCGQLVASARLCAHDLLDDVPDAHVYRDLSVTGPVVSMNRLVVESSARGLGLSRRLDDYRLALGRAWGTRIVVVNVLAVTGMPRVHSLERRGFSRLYNGFDRLLDQRGACLALYRSE